ncbi:hypothetical protein EWM64_g7157, partial [Hericium alpestre]
MSEPSASSSNATVIKVTILAANGLVKRDLFSLPNPFAVVTVDGEQTQNTTVIKKTLTPYWNETFGLDVQESSQLSIQIFDHRRFKRSDQGFLGEVNVRVGDVLNLSSGGHEPRPAIRTRQSIRAWQAHVLARASRAGAGAEPPTTPNIELARSFSDLRVATNGTPASSEAGSTLPRNRSLQPVPSRSPDFLGAPVPNLSSSRSVANIRISTPPAPVPSPLSARPDVSFAPSMPVPDLPSQISLHEFLSPSASEPAPAQAPTPAPPAAADD